MGASGRECVESGSALGREESGSDRASGGEGKSGDRGGRRSMLAADKLGPARRDSFLADTSLIDRTTTIRAYLAERPQVMATAPPPRSISRMALRARTP